MDVAEGGKDICGYVGKELTRQKNGKSQNLKEGACLAQWRKAGTEAGEEGRDVDGEERRAAT